ncbi:GNAT family N-acetyltransferase [Paenibacillus lemnae]|uniref:GNAT family N-acetyltransferase n=1 Tax=Paenibacillus lemnae TaxID=1330551 RepID=A0A848M9W6_PAELE|nr:GNAT family N-acetyltransferase [Paenibacillus lemnae]NMO97049.1 GNAT family N-acetyltransferase [Paenibacillus lemnae]
MKVKQYQQMDLMECVNVFMQVCNQEPWNDSWIESTAERYLKDITLTPGFLGITIIQNETIVGFVFGVIRHWWSGDEFFIHEMCVRSDLQNSGIGSILLQTLEEELINAKVGNITLLTDRNIPAETFYKKFGFSAVERLVFLNKNLDYNR